MNAPRITMDRGVILTGSRPFAVHDAIGFTVFPIIVHKSSMDF